MGTEKVRRAFAVKGPLTIGGDTKLERSSANVLDLATGDKLRFRSGTIILGTDTTVKRDGAGTVGIGAADVLNLGGTVLRLIAPSATAYPTLAKNGEVAVVSAAPGTARIYWRAGGTTYYVDAS